MSTSPRPVRDLRVIDAMHPGMISCPPETSLRTVARMMATYRVHAIVVHAHGDEELPGGKPWGVVADADLVRAVRDADSTR
jgi:CBS domain-containing protein